MSEMSFEDARAALDRAIEADAQPEAPAPVAPPVQESKPETQPHPEGSDPAATPEAPVAPAVDSEPSFMERADLDALLADVQDPVARERIERAYKSFQSGFTQARQRESEIMRQYSELGELEELRQAAALRQSLQDPGNLVQLYGELGDYLQNTGLVRLDEGYDEPGAPELPDLSQIEDPEMEPLKQAFQSLRGELDQLRQERQAEQQARQAQMMHDSLVGELQRQENIIRQSHPTYKDEHIDAVYELGSFYEGNLLKAQERLEALRNLFIEDYLASKASAVEATSPVPTYPVQPAAPAAEGHPVTLDDAHKAAIEALRHIEAQDL